MHDLARLPAIQRLIADGPYCQIAQEYLGCRPTLAHISLLLDAPFEGKYGAYSYHYDNEGPGFLKFFIFLTNVDVGTGAHYFIAGSHTHNKPDPFARATLYDEGPLLSIVRPRQGDRRCADRRERCWRRIPPASIVAASSSAIIA